MEYTYRETSIKLEEIQSYIKDKISLSDKILLPLMEIIKGTPVGSLTISHFDDIIWGRRADGTYFLSVNRRERLKGDVY